MRQGSGGIVGKAEAIQTGFWEMTDGTCGRGVAHPNIITVLDLHGRLSLNSTAVLNLAGSSTTKIVSKQGFTPGKAGVRVAIAESIGVAGKCWRMESPQWARFAECSTGSANTKCRRQAFRTYRPQLAKWFILRVSDVL
jgi:hypothetical protein